MANIMSRPCFQDVIQKKQVACVEFFLLDTAKTITYTQQQMGIPWIVGHDAGDFTQAASDALIGTNDISNVTTAFGSTAMGTDALGFIINLGGQAAALEAIIVTAYLSAVVVAYAPPTTVGNTLANQAAVTTAGNVYGHVVLTGLDAGTCRVRVQVMYYSK